LPEPGPRRSIFRRTGTASRAISFKDRPFSTGSGLVVLDAPRARRSPPWADWHARQFRRRRQRHACNLTLVIDENPAPVRPERLRWAPHSGVTSLSTRVRVNSYSYVRLVADLTTAKLYGVKTFVKASGGKIWRRLPPMPTQSNRLSAEEIPPPPSGPDSVLTTRSPFHDAPSRRTQAFDGSVDAALHRAVLRENLPQIWQGDDLVMTMDGGIAIAEIRTYVFNTIQTAPPIFTPSARHEPASVQDELDDREIGVIAASKLCDHRPKRSLQKHVFRLPLVDRRIPATQALPMFGATEIQNDLTRETLGGTSELGLAVNESIVMNDRCVSRLSSMNIFVKFPEFHR